MAEADPELRAYLALNPSEPFPLLRLPETLVLHVFSYLDLPDLGLVAATGHPDLVSYSEERVLHVRRLKSVGPSVERHLRTRPGRLDLGVMQHLKGLNVQTRAANGQYLGSPTSQRRFDAAMRIGREMLARRLAKGLDSRPSLESLIRRNILDPELLFSMSAPPRTALNRLRISPTLAPALRLLKRERTKDELARRMRSRNAPPSTEGDEAMHGWKTFSAAQRGDAARWRDESHLSVRLAIVSAHRSSVR